MSVVGIIERLMRNNHDRAARAYLSQIEDHYGQYKNRIEKALNRLSNKSGYRLLLGESTWDRKINIPPKDFLTAHGLIQGGTGSGKSYYILSLISQLLQNPALPIGFGVVDPKGELFQKIVNMMVSLLNSTDGKTRDQLVGRIRIIDFADNKSIVPYNILKRRGDEPLEFLISNRLDSICEFFSGSSSLSVRMRLTLKYFLLLMSEFELPIIYFDRLCEFIIWRIRSCSATEIIGLCFPTFF